MSSFFKNLFSSDAAKRESSQPPASPQSDGTIPKTEELQRPIPESEADEVLPENSRSLLGELVRANGLSIGMDLSRIVLPTFILEPRSLLAKLGDCLAHSERFATIPDGATPEQRMVRAVQWFMTAHHKRPKGVRKPYNPVLGETFHARYVPGVAGAAAARASSVGSTASSSSSSPGASAAAAAAAAAADDDTTDAAASVEWFAQQVSHHPPVSAAMLRSSDGRVISEAVFAPKTRFLGNSASLTPDGCMNIFLPEHNWEMYCISWPTAYVRGLLLGAMLMEYGGTVRIRCAKTGLGADIEFITKGIFTGSYHEVEGYIFRAGKDGSSTNVPLYKVSGKWTEAVAIEEIATNTVVSAFDVAKQPLSTVEVLPSGGAAPDLDADAAPPADDSDLTCMWDADATWARVTAAITSGKQEDATRTKSDVENHQRRLRTRREEKKVELVPSLFRPGKMFKAPSGSEFRLWHFAGPGAMPLYEMAGVA